MPRVADHRRADTVVPIGSACSVQAEERHRAARAVRRQVKAVIELASLSMLSPLQVAFLEQLTASIGIVLNSIEATMQTEGLLKESQQLATELQSQQRELQQTNEQLEQKAQQLPSATSKWSARTRKSSRRAAPSKKRRRNWR